MVFKSFQNQPHFHADVNHQIERQELGGKSLFRDYSHLKSDGVDGMRKIPKNIHAREGDWKKILQSDKCSIKGT